MSRKILFTLATAATIAAAATLASSAADARGFGGGGHFGGGGFSAAASAAAISLAATISVDAASPAFTRAAPVAGVTRFAGPTTIITAGSGAMVAGSSNSAKQQTR